MTRLICCALLLGLAVGPAWADPDDVTNAKDHPLLPRLPDFVIEAYEEDIDAVDFFVAGDKRRTLKGHKIHLRYVLKGGGDPPGPQPIMGNYARAVRKLGGETVYEGETEESMRQGTYRLVQGGKEIWVKVDCAVDGRVYHLTVLEQGEMAQDVTAAELLAALDRDGRVALYLNFDPGQAGVKPEFKPVLDLVAALLQENPGLRLGVEAHTDDQGSADHNRALSQRRAQAVVQALVQAGVAPERLAGKGWGADKPLTGNDTEAGRAQNRRVELVKR